MSFTNYVAALTGLLQTGFLEREMEEGLDSVLAYRREAVQEKIAARIGETLTKTRKGRKAPAATALNPASMTGLDNGLTPTTFTMEQYQFNMSPYGDTVDVDLMTDLAGIADQLIANSRNNGVQAAQSLERVARQKLFAAYLGGNTTAISGGTLSTTQAHVDDIRGFQFVLVNGVLTAVSGTNTLSVTEIATSASGVNQTLVVTGAAADGTNHAAAPDGISGQLTFQTATTPVVGDTFVATNSPKIFRPFGKSGTALLANSDVLTLGLIEDAVAYLRDNGVPPMADGTYHLILDNTSMRQLFADQDFKVLFAGRAQSTEWRDGEVIELLGVTYIPTTEAYVQLASTRANGGAETPAVPVRVRRPILMGAEALIQGNFEGLDYWLDSNFREGIDGIHNIWVIDNVAQIARPPLDRLARTASLSWHWIGDFAVPSDLTATSSIIPTASGAMFKRCCVIEHAG